MFPRDSDEQRRVMYQEQVKTNALLERLVTLMEVNTDKPFKPPETNVRASGIDEMKRPELMKEIAKLENNPQGWNTWATDKMREYLKGAMK